MRTRSIPANNGRASENYFVRDTPRADWRAFNTWKQVVASKIFFEGFADLDLFLWEDADDYANCKVYEGLTGLAIATGTFAGVQESARTIVKDMGAKMGEHIAASLKYGVSPRYGGTAQ